VYRDETHLRQLAFPVALVVEGQPTFAAVQPNPRVTFLVSDFLAFSRHDWVDPDDGGRATLNFRAAAYECLATTTTRPREVAAVPTTLSAAEMTRGHRRARGTPQDAPGVRPAIVINDPAFGASQPEPGLAASAA